jgi:hypothetical protein
VGPSGGSAGVAGSGGTSGGKGGTAGTGGVGGSGGKGGSAGSGGTGGKGGSAGSGGKGGSAGSGGSGGSGGKGGSAGTSGTAGSAGQPATCVSCSNDRIAGACSAAYSACENDAGCKAIQACFAANCKVGSGGAACAQTCMSSNCDPLSAQLFLAAESCAFCSSPCTSLCSSYCGGLQALGTCGASCEACGKPGNNESGVCIADTKCECAPGYLDCYAGYGCETTSNDDNCGTCGTTCAWNQDCIGGHCL